MSTGMDPTGAQSVIALGVYDSSAIDACDPTATTCPGEDIASLNPGPGVSENTILQELGTEFNTDFGSSGFVASYDPTTDMLSLDTTLNAPEVFFTADTDTGISYSIEVDAVPEPSSLFMLAFAVAGLALLGRRKAA